MKLLTIIIPRSKGSEIMSYLDRNQAKYITCYFGEGSASDEILSRFKINKLKKEIVFAIIDDQAVERILIKLERKIKKVNTAILFTTPLDNEGVAKMDYEALYIIVDREKGNRVIEVAQKNGAKGATIIHGRGAGIQKKSIFINMTIEPEKDIVLMLVKKELTENIRQAIYKEMDLEKESKGIMFTLPVTDVRGLVEQV